MPTIKVSKLTYKMLLRDLAKENARAKGSLLKFSGRWSDIPKSKVEEAKEILRSLREESSERVL